VKNISFLVSILFTFNLYADYRIISDFDDTIKRSNIVNGGKRTLTNAFLFHKVYRGIPTLYREMEKGSNGLYVLSASPTVVKPFIESSLKDFKIPHKEVFTRLFWEFYGEERKISYKIKRIERVLNLSDDSLILLGDNVEADHTLYMEVSDKYPGRVEQIYIRNVLGEDLPRGIFGFYTPYEVASNEYLAGRFKIEDVQKVAKVILNTKRKF
jgi:phosphatidate phosphatase APP1